MTLKDFTKRLITSVLLIILLGLSFSYSFILIISLTLVSVISWIEFNKLNSKIFKKQKKNIFSINYWLIF